MAKLKMKKKALVLSLAMLATSIGAFAQDGLFQRGVNDEAYSGYGCSTDKAGLLDNRSGIIWSEGGMFAQDPTQPAPLGNGLFILVATGVGYVTLKRKEDKQ